MAVILILLGLYVSLPILAPLLLQRGNQTAAKVIYLLYSPLCHQLPYRSFFIGGLQPFYPRELAGVEGYATFEQIFVADPQSLGDVRKITGAESIGDGHGHVGYKLALCERDIAIYSALFIFGVIFVLAKRRIKGLPWYLWALFGLVPIAIDGFSQLPSLIPMLRNIEIHRESTPFLRVFTGTLFGTATAWYLYPMIEESMRETKKSIGSRLEQIKLRSR
ncbi:MAG TPA: DUF2085 domain-containing protein [Bellilinea sp.]|nr:DUF2085 domain-containing protein [Bellilinea sp.]